MAPESHYKIGDQLKNRYTGKILVIDRIREGMGGKIFTLSDGANREYSDIRDFWILIEPEAKKP